MPDVASRVHEYGGLAYGSSGSEIVWVSSTDGQVHRGRVIDSRLVDERTLTNSHLRFGQPVIAGNDVVVIAEDHTGAANAADVENSLLRISPDGELTIVARGADFYSDPTILPDGRVAYCTWNHPNMPWDACSIRISNDSILTADHDEISIGPVTYQPLVDANNLYVMSDSTGWLNLYRVRLDDLDAEPEAVYPIAADCAQPMWNFGRRDYAISGSDVFVAVARDGVWRLHSVATGGAVDTELEVMALADNTERVIGVFSSPTVFPFIGEVGTTGVVPLTDVETLPGPKSAPEAITYPVGDETAHAFFYEPVSDRFVGLSGERPPLIVMVHGGPTSQAHANLSAMTQYWTTRGFAVVDINHRGSSGWGRTYRDRLHGGWGVVDVEDCSAAVTYLAAAGRIDPHRVAIRGGSAGGFTTLAALASTDVFTAGASYYGIADIGMLARDTHKFESHYPQNLIAPYPDPIYEERSPINHIDEISAPLILFQGLDDKVVPPNQSHAMAAALEAGGQRVELHEYAGEGHGFKITANLVDSLERERAFYLDVWGDRK